MNICRCSQLLFRRHSKIEGKMVSKIVCKSCGGTDCLCPLRGFNFSNFFLHSCYAPEKKILRSTLFLCFVFLYVYIVAATVAALRAASKALRLAIGSRPVAISTPSMRTIK